MIGIQIIKRIIDYVFPEVMEDAVNSPRSAEAAVQVLYYFTIIEFVFAVVRNKNAFWIGLHNIIDGTIDTDRLDFVPRDSRNSGMTWGEVPYKRLINTAVSYTHLIGIVGPKRMDYENVLKTLKTLTDQLDAIYNKKQN